MGYYPSAAIEGKRKNQMQLLKGRYRSLDLMRLAGLFAWLCTTIPLFFVPILQDEPLSSSVYATWWGLQLLYAAVYWRLTYLIVRQQQGLERKLYLVLLTICALAISYVSDSALGGILLLVVAGLLPWILSPLMASAWMIFQNGLLAVIISKIPEIDFTNAVLTAGIFLGISLFISVSSLAALRQTDARIQLRKVNSELRATQALLTENTRMAERVRIARELHDLVGHHLTALTLNLEVVTHLVDGKVLEHVEQARSLAKMLLADVREVVSDMRRGDQVDLSRALRTLVEGVPEPRVHLDLPSDLVMIDPHQAHILLRCVQEIITNSVRHAHAENLWIRLSESHGGIAMSARDDGRGVSKVEAGNGLRGMEERLIQLGGKLEVESQRGAGFTLHAWVPAEA